MGEVEQFLDEQEQGEEEQLEAGDEVGQEAQEEGAPQEAPPQNHVPITALHEERDRRRELQRSLDEQRDRMTRMETTFNHFRQQQEAPPERLPEYDEDPEAHLLGRMEEMQQRINQHDQIQQQRQVQDQQVDQERRFYNGYAGTVDAFIPEHPDFKERYNFTVDAIDKDLEARGYSDPMERSNIIKQEERALVQRAVQNGQNPAEVIYKYAESRGYAAEPQEDTIERLERGAAASTSLSGARGKSPSNGSLESLSRLMDEDPAMADAEWNKMVRKGLLG